MISLGIDTSNYTTSVSAFDGNTYSLTRKILHVKEGMRGIRQSEGVFIHNRELPDMLDIELRGKTPDVIGVSTRPRSVEGSYMPVFTVGHGYARAISRALNASLYEFSHQDGHIMAGVYSAKALELLNEPFISVHLSGGTTEILKTTYNGYNFDNEIIGGTLDISIGQLIDRVGVKMGLKFPCGVELERLAMSGEKPFKLPMSINDTFFNLSGVETKLISSIMSPSGDVALSVFEYIKVLLVRSLQNAVKKTGISKLLIVGGVASNQILRKGIEEQFGGDAFFATKELSSDNAVGIAVLAHLAKEQTL